MENKIMNGAVVQGAENIVSMKRGKSKIHAGIDAGNGYFKYFFQTFRGEESTTQKGFFESVIDIDATKNTGDIGDTDVVFINGHACKINSGKRIGERREAFTKQNEYTRANFYFSLLTIYLQSMSEGEEYTNDFYVALGTTTDIFKDDDEREEYKEYMLGNIDYEMYGDKPLNGKITFRYWNKKRQDYSNATINIKELIIQAEGTASLMDLDTKENGFDFEKKTVILDIGSQTLHAIPYVKKTAIYDNADPNREAGYIEMIKRLQRPLSKKALTQFSYQDAEVEFKRRSDKEFKAEIDKAVEKYIKDIVVTELEGVNTQIGRDQIVVTGGTSVAIKSDLEKYFAKNYKTKLMFVRDGFYATAKGLLVILNRELKKKNEMGRVNR